MKPESHKRITALALDLFTRDRESSLVADLSGNLFRNALLQGTKYEDEFTPTRGLNWHFYPANQTIKAAEHVLLKQPRIIIKPTSEGILLKRQKGLAALVQNGPSVGLFELFGRVLHHLQDMSTPTHVVPVYHGPGNLDPYEEYLEKKWQLIAPRIDENQLLEQLSGQQSATDFKGLYDRAGSRLLDYLFLAQTEFPVTINHQPTTAPGTIFWEPFDAARHSSGEGVPFHIRGFGRFGPLGSNYAADTPVKIGKTTYRADQEVFLSLATFFVNCAVIDTLSAFLIFEKLTTSHD